MRLLLKIPFHDRTSTAELLSKTGLLSINQLAASIKLMEVWKSENVPNYPIQLEPNNTIVPLHDRNLRPSSTRQWNQDANFSAAKECFSRSAAKLWNMAPTVIKTAKCPSAAKTAIKNHCKLLPILTPTFETILLQRRHKWPG